MRVEIDKYLSVSFSEKLLRRGLVNVGPLELDLSSLAIVQVGAGWRLANLIGLIGRHATLVAHVPNPGKSFDGRWYTAFTRSGIAAALADSASSVLVDGSEILPELQAYYHKHRVRLGQNSVSVTGLEEIENLCSGRFTDAVSPWLRRVNVKATNLVASELSQLLVLLQESLENVVDHAARSPLPLGTKIGAAFALAYYKVDEPGAAKGRDREFLGKMHELDPTRKLVGFVEITVSDSGVGLAARHTQSAEVYREDFALELRAFEDALESRASIKSRVSDSVIRGSEPGMGFTMMADALDSLDAHFELRSGRTYATYEGMDPEAQFVVSGQEWGFLPGTLLSVLVPLREAQLRMDYNA